MSQVTTRTYRQKSDHAARADEVTCLGCKKSAPCACGDAAKDPVRIFQQLFATAIRASRQPKLYLSAWVEAHQRRVRWGSRRLSRWSKGPEGHME